MEFQKRKDARGFEFDFYVTDHSADKESTGKPELLAELYDLVKADGIRSVRYDWHWSKVAPKPGEYSREHLDRYARAKKNMEEVGLREPTIILSNPPKWAKSLYRKDKGSFFRQYEKYVIEVRNSLEAAGGKKVAIVQVLNELNNSVYTPIDVEDVAYMCDITREVFQPYNPDIRVMVTLLAANLPEMLRRATLGLVSLGTPIGQFLPRLKKIRNSFDIVAVDYYPGMWHLDPKGAKSLKLVDLYKAMVKNTELLQTSFEEIATWGKEYELGEIGMRTNMRDGERSQRYFYDAFFRAFRRMMIEMREKGLKLPSRIGFYEAIDEPPKNFTGRVLQRLPFPEYSMGIWDERAKPKSILTARIDLSTVWKDSPSQLAKIMAYLRSPV